jgi:hypothetical protein
MTWELTNTRWSPADVETATAVAVALGYDPDEATETDEANIATLARAVAQLRIETVRACKERLRAKANETAQLGGEDGPTGALWLDRAANSLSVDALFTSTTQEKTK